MKLELMATLSRSATTSRAVSAQFQPSSNPVFNPVSTTKPRKRTYSNARLTPRKNRTEKRDKHDKRDLRENRKFLINNKLNENEMADNNSDTENNKIPKNLQKIPNSKAKSDSDSANLGDIEDPVVSPQAQIKDIPDSQYVFARSRGRKRMRRGALNYDDAHNDNDDQADDERDVKTKSGGDHRKSNADYSDQELFVTARLNTHLSLNQQAYANRDKKLKEQNKQLPPRLLREKAEALDEKIKKEASFHFQIPKKEQLDKNPLWINNTLKQTCQNHQNPHSNINIDPKNFFGNTKTAFNLTSFNNSAFQKPLPQTQFSNTSSKQENQLYNTTQAKFNNKNLNPSNNTTTESLIDKLTVMNCAPSVASKIQDTSIADNSLEESLAESLAESSAESLAESQSNSSSDTCHMQHVVNKRPNNSENGSEMDSDNYIESYKDQAKANQTDCLGDDELSESEKRTKRTTKSLKSSRFKKRYIKKQVNL